MIQRAQSLYMFMVVIIMSLLFLFPLAIFVHQEGSVSKFLVYGLVKFTGEEKIWILKSYPLMVLVIAIAVLNLYAIFQFAKRPKQFRINVYTILLEIGLIVLILYYYNHINQNIPITGHKFRIALIFPLIGIFLNLMSLRGIGHDEMLVRSYERLRK